MTAIHSYLHWNHRPFSRGTAVALAVAALGGTMILTGGPGLTSEPAEQQAPTISRLPLTKRVLPSNAFPEFVATSRPAVVSDATAWASSAEHSVALASETARLRQLGFVAGVAEQLRGLYPGTNRAISSVEQFSSPAAARAELAYQHKRLSAGNATSFNVAGIPGAVGVKASNRRTASVDVMFAAGSYYYLIGSQSPRAAHGALTPRQLIGGAEAMYLLINGCTAPGAIPQIAS